MTEPEPFAEPHPKRVCDAAFGLGGTVVLSKHAKQRMAECGLNMNDVRNTLKGGQLINFEPGSGGAYKYRMSTRRVDAVIIVTGPANILVVTAFRSDR